ncbi:MAG: hypothetical protein IKU23_08520 [Clostridia bacterium]|nr:hypothetical protein [Clostridia bacterium]
MLIKAQCNDINPQRDLRYTPKARDMCCPRDMPCGAKRDLYHIAFIAREIYRFFRWKKYRIAKQYIAKNYPKKSFLFFG